MTRMRTINQTMNYLKEKDPNTAISEWYLRQMLKTGELKHHRAGNKYLINIDYLEKFLNNPRELETKELNEYGTIRKIY